MNPENLYGKKIAWMSCKFVTFYRTSAYLIFLNVKFTFHLLHVCDKQIKFIINDLMSFSNIFNAFLAKLIWINPKKLEV